MKRQIMGLLGGFLALMLLFTFLSRAADSMTVPRVKVQAPERKKITHPVSGSGKVVQNREETVKIQSGQLVKSIAVDEGTMVGVGDLLFEIDLEDVKEQLQTARGELKKLQLQQEDAVSQQEAAAREKQTAIERARQDCQTAQEKGDAAVNTALQALTQAQEELQEAKEAQKETEKKTKKGKKEESKSEKETASETEDSLDALTQAVEEQKAAYEEALSQREESIRTAQRSLEDAQKEESSDSTAQISAIDMKQKKKEIKKLEKLMQQEGRVTSPVEGVVTKISLTVGERTPDGAAMLLADASAGCKLVVQMPASQEEYIARNDPVTVTPSASQEKITDLTVDAVKVNDQDETLLDVTISLPDGALEIGTSATAVVARESEAYSACVPVQALYQGDQNQYYVLIVQEQETVLGTQLTAKRMDVTVLDKNDSYAALSEDSLGVDENVIVESDRVLEDGSRVRLMGE